MAGTPKKNKVRYGLTNVHIAKLTISEDGGYTFEKPQRLPGAISLTLTPKGETVTLAADDDDEYARIDVNSGYDSTLEMARIDDDFYVQYLGEIVDSKKVQFEKSDSEIHSPFALLFEFTGDVKKIRHVMYHCQASRPEISSKTRNKSLEIATESLKLTMKNIPGTNLVKAKTKEDTDPAVYESWYDEVYTETKEVVQG